jgi:uncharacterized protein (DUF2336 family)
MSNMSASPGDLFDELEHEFDRSTPNRRLAALWYATDTLLTGHYSEDQIWMFGEVIDRLAAELEVNTRARLANRLSQSDKAPLQTVRKLACDDSIEVAGPVLRHSRRLNEETLTNIAGSKSQLHLRAIAQRESVTEGVTDVLVTRGDQEVVRVVANNAGARFSDTGFLQLMKRSENDSILVERIGQRKDIPRHLFIQLIAKASDEVKARLAAIAPQAGTEIDRAVADATGEVQAKVGPASKEYFAAKKLLREMYRRGQLGESELLEFAKSKKLIETTVALSLLCGLPVDAAERALIGDDADMILIVAKSAGLSWPTAQALLLMASPKGMAKPDMDAALHKFSRLSPSGARSVIAFFEERRRSAAVGSQ